MKTANDAKAPPGEVKSLFSLFERGDQSCGPAPPTSVESRPLPQIQRRVERTSAKGPARPLRGGYFSTCRAAPQLKEAPLQVGGFVGGLPESPAAQDERRCGVCNNTIESREGGEHKHRDPGLCVQRVNMT